MVPEPGLFAANYLWPDISETFGSRADSLLAVSGTRGSRLGKWSEKITSAMDALRNVSIKYDKHEGSIPNPPWS